MDYVNGEETAIVRAVLVGDRARIDCLPRHFGVMGIVAEHTVYALMGRMCAEYHGAYWHYYELDNGGFYMAPDVDAPYRLCVEGNGYEGTLSPDAAGIVSCAMAYSHLSFRRHGAVFARAFHLLRAYALIHPDTGEILRALD